MNNDDILDRLAEDFEPIDPRRLAMIRDRMAADTVPVKPLPSDRVLIGSLTAFFLAFSLLAAWLVSMKGLQALTANQAVFYYGLILVCAVEGAAVVVGEMIPGSAMRARRRIWIAASAVALPLLCVALFNNYSANRFIHFGLGCLEIGSASALVAGVLISLIVRKGFFASQRSAARSTGFFAALAGVAVLALHCPLLSVAHIIVWHFGVLLLGWLMGDLVGRRLESR